jgi:hypothetical protein
MEAELFGGLELNRQALPEVPPDMDFEITAIVVREGTGWDQPPIRVRMQILANSASVITPCWTLVMAICHIQTADCRFPSAVRKLADQAADREAASAAGSTRPHELGLER